MVHRIIHRTYLRPNSQKTIVNKFFFFEYFLLYDFRIIALCQD